MQLGELKILSGNANQALAQEICDNIGIPLCDVTLKRFPDGEIFVKINENVRGKDVFIIQPTSPPANDHLMELLIMIDAAKRASARRITAVLPFFGYARQDRKDQPRVPITAKLVANILVTAGAERVLTMDLHASQIQGFFDIPVDHLYAVSVFYDYLKKYQDKKLMVISPDVGGVKMGSAYSDLFDGGFGFIVKRRKDSENVKATSLVGDVKDREVLIVDDMTETAGTLIAAAELLKENGALSVRAAVSHCMLSEKGYKRLSETDLIDELITTNSAPIDSKGLPITILSIGNILTEAIIRINEHRSITKLFKIKGF